VFYFVGVAYADVSEVTRFILFMGAIDSLVHTAWRFPDRLQPEPAAASGGAEALSHA
jgi:hypothetical protein